MMDSILNSIKKLLGIAPEYDRYDTDIIMHINSAFSTLTQLGVGPDNGYKIIDEQDIWSDFIQDDNLEFEDVKTYVYQKVKLKFDPPLSGTLINEMKDDIKELEWRLNVKAES